MVTSVIGKIFLEAYNARYGTSYSAEQFFKKEFYPLFYDHQKYMMSAGNSPLENPKITWNSMVLGKCDYESPERRKERYDLLLKKINTGIPDASYAIGYPSFDVSATTSGQVSNIFSENSIEDIYLSWIGAALGVGVEGGWSIFFYEANILLDICEGWNIYRFFLNNTKVLKGNQITTWNGQWLVHRYGKLYCRDNPLANIDNQIFSKCKANKWIGCIEFSLQTWVKILISISTYYPFSKLMSYVYSFGTTNTTIGFIPLDLSQISRPVQLYKKFFGMDSGHKAEKLWGTAIGFAKACQQGVIGLRAMEPKGLRDYIEKGKMPRLSDKEEQIISFNVYQSWIMAMLNNQDLWDKAQEFASELYRYSSSGNRAKTVNVNKVNRLLESTNKMNFMRSMVEIIEDAESIEKMKNIAFIINNMPTDNVPYFLTLIRFHYATFNNTKKK
ncbi:hypothetical protein [uncultured Bacteroides sp.]|uniref:hypothetical protein n=1 Tax=uncultured Bacteroides sp. TaxID=162156 RepID=UPI002632E1B1|nr:hypothetical protein [uncultured Bacteroides sp.]